MSKFNVQSLLKDTTVVIKKHSPEILTGIGVAGMITTTIFAVKATPKALMLIEERKLDLNTEELPKTEVVKAVWKCYIPTVITGTLSIACIVGASSVNLRRNAALATAYTLANTSLEEYREKVIEQIGEKKETLVRDAVAKSKIDANPVGTSEVVITNKGETLCYEPLSGRYFKSDIEKIKRSLNEINSRLLNDSYISLNEFYAEIGLEDTKIGNDLGWRMDAGGLIEIAFSSHLSANGEPCLVIDFIKAPTYDFDRWL